MYGKSNYCVIYWQTTMHFICYVTLFFANNSLTECRITIEFYTIFSDPEVIFRSHTMIIIASAKEFTLIHLVTFSISRSRIRTNIYIVYSLIRL